MRGCFERQGSIYGINGIFQINGMGGNAGNGIAPTRAFPSTTWERGEGNQLNPPSFLLFLVPIGISSVVVAARLFFCKTMKDRIIACLLMPFLASLLTTIVGCLYIYATGGPPSAYSGYGICLFILPFSFVWSYVALPFGIFLAFIATILGSGFTPYEPYKSDKVSSDKL